MLKPYRVYKENSKWHTSVCLHYNSFQLWWSLIYLIRNGHRSRTQQNNNIGLFANAAYHSKNWDPHKHIEDHNMLNTSWAASLRHFHKHLVGKRKQGTNSPEQAPLRPQIWRRQILNPPSQHFLQNPQNLTQIIRTLNSLIPKSKWGTE